MKITRILMATTLATLIGFGALACGGGGGSGDPVRDAIHQNFGDYPAMESKATSVVQCESGMNPNAYNPSGYYGLFQLSKYFHERTANSMGYSWSQIYDPYVNARVARVVYNQAGGWGPWQCA